LFKYTIWSFNGVLSDCRGYDCCIVIFEIKGGLVHDSGRRIVAASVFVDRLCLSRYLYEIKVGALVLSASWTNIKARFLLAAGVNFDTVPSLAKTISHILSLRLILHHYQTLV